MAEIRIRHAHDMPLDEARHAAQQIAQQLVQDYQVAVEWAGDVMRFARSGVAGTLTLVPNEARVEMRLGFPYSAFAGAVEQKLLAKLRKVFG